MEILTQFCVLSEVPAGSDSALWLCSALFKKKKKKRKIRIFLIKLKFQRISWRFVIASCKKYVYMHTFSFRNTFILISICLAEFWAFFFFYMWTDCIHLGIIKVLNSWPISQVEWLLKLGL